MKLFFNIPTDSPGTQDPTKCIMSSEITTDETYSNIQDSVVCNVKANVIKATGGIIMNCVANSITVNKGAICYNIITNKDIILEENEVMVGVYNASGEQTVIRSNLDIDGGMYMYVYIYKCSVCLCDAYV